MRNMRNKYLLIFVMAMLLICSHGQIAAAQNIVPATGGLEWLANPELLTEADIRRFGRQIRDLLMGETSSGLFDAETYRIIKQEAGFFAKFSDSRAADDCYQNIAGKIYVRMPRYLDPAFKESLLGLIRTTYVNVTRRWAKIGCQAPRGFIFVWLISDIEKMRREFAAGRDVMAFTLPCRYIVIPYQVISDAMQYDLMAGALLENGNPHEVRTNIDNFLKKNFTVNLAHELTHVLTFTNIGLGRLNDLDKWFYEGTAIWLSGDNGAGLAPEYKDYKNTFDFIRMKYGNQRFQQFIRDGIHKSVAASLQHNLQLPYYGHLEKQAKRRFTGMKRAEIILSILVVLVFSLAAGRWARSRPAYLYYLNLLLLGALYGWIYGLYNLWTDSIPGGAVLNIAAAILILGIGFWDIRHFYYYFRLTRAINNAQTFFNQAIANQSPDRHPVEYENIQNMLELARLNQDPMEIPSRDSLGKRSSP